MIVIRGKSDLRRAGITAALAYKKVQEDKRSREYLAFNI